MAMAMAWQWHGVVFLEATHGEDSLLFLDPHITHPALQKPADVVASSVPKIQHQQSCRDRNFRKAQRNLC